MNKGQLAISFAIDATMFLLCVYYAGGLVTRVEALEKTAVSQSQVAVIEEKLRQQKEQLDKIDTKLDVALNALVVANNKRK